MIKKIGIMFLMAGILISLIPTVQAQMVDYNRRRFRQQANTQNAQTAVTTATTQEQASEQVTGSWKTNPVKVQSYSEQRFDYDNDGYLDRTEAIAFLQDVVKQVKAKGLMALNSDILKEYDKNGDNLIDRTELKDISRDIGK